MIEESERRTLMFKKSISIALIALILTGSSLYPRRSHAVVGAATGIFPLVVAGSATMGGGVVCLSGSLFCYMLGGGDSALWFYSMAIPLLFVGGALLDEPGGRTLKFSELGGAAQEKLGLSDAEMKEFNSEVPNLNAIVETIGRELSSLDQMKLKKKKLLQLKKEKSTALWDRYKSTVSPISIQVLEKMEQYLVSQK